METISFSDPLALCAVAAAMALGGVLKGAAGAGVPIIAIPVMATVYDVKVAVALMVIPNLVSNIWQSRKYRAHRLEPGFARNLAVSGAAGAAIGTVLLTHLPVTILERSMAVIVMIYIGMRLAKPDMELPLALARRLVWPVGVAGGILQGAIGISAPISVTFMNAMRLARPTFILTISVFFAAMCLTQLPLQIFYGLMTPNVALLGTLALVPMFLAMPLGEWIGRRISAALFDKVILAFLTILAIRAVF